MPTYEYACTECGHRFDAVQPFSEDALSVCPECGGVLRKVYGSVGVVFKGSGFYRTDSRSNSKSAAAAAAAAKGSTDAGSGSSGGSTDATPSPSKSSGAPAPAAASAHGSSSKAAPSKAAAG